jgi:hypothetical protein
MERVHELEFKMPGFHAELDALMGRACVVKIHGWSRAKDEALVLKLIKEHGYVVEVYTILNVAKLFPKFAVAGAPHTTDTEVS